MSESRDAVTRARPHHGQSADAFGHHIWRLGQSRDDPLVEGWEDIKVAVMYVLNCAKYLSSPAMVTEIMQVGDVPMTGGHSTWEWSKWNGAIHMIIREKIVAGGDLQVEVARSVCVGHASEVKAIMDELEAIWTTRHRELD